MAKALNSKQQNSHQTIAISTQCLDHWRLEFGVSLEFWCSDLEFQIYYGGNRFRQSSCVAIDFDGSMGFGLSGLLHTGYCPVYFTRAI